MPTKSSSRTERSWGGKRAGAGRKPAPGSFGKGHHVRSPIDPRRPVTVELHLLAGLRSVPRAAVRDALLRADAILEDRAELEVKRVSVTKRTVHLVVMAGSHDDLTTGMHTVAIVLARAINRALDRTGTVFAHRYATSQS